MIKECNPGTTQGNCWATGNMKYLDGSPDTVWDPPTFINNQPSIVTADGTTIFFEFFGTNCTNGASEECFRFNVDVNGMQGPNTYGKDIFFAHVYNVGPKVAPMNGDCTTDGRGCSTEYLYK